MTTARDQQVLQGVVAGRGATEVTARLSVSVQRPVAVTYSQRSPARIRAAFLAFAQAAVVPTLFVDWSRRSSQYEPVVRFWHPRPSGSRCRQGRSAICA